MKRRLGLGMVLVVGAAIGLFSAGCSNGGSKVDPADLDLVEVEDGDTEVDSEEADTDSDLTCKEEVTYPAALEFGAVMSSGTNTKTLMVYASPSHLIKRALIVNDDATPKEFSFVTSATLPCADVGAENCHRVEINKAANSVEPLQIAILYTPKDGALPDTAELEIETDDPCVPTKRIPLSSSCKGVYALAVTVDGQAVSATNPLTFGPVMPANPVNPSAPKVIKLMNTGLEGNNASVFVSLSFDNTFSDNFEFTGAGCTLTDLTKGFVLGIGESRTCSLNFRGRATPGDYTSQVTVNWNSSCSAAAGSPSSPIALPLTGTVAQCQIIVDPNPKLDFGDVVIGERVRDHFTITNDCPYKMLWSGCSLATGTQFSVECPVGGLLFDSKSSKELSVSVKPTATDWQQDTLTLNFSLEDGSNSQIVTRYLVAKVPPCTTPTCCPPDSAGCAPGFTRCGTDNGLELCNSSCNWVAATPCAAPMICKEGACVPPICIDGQTKCASNVILECASNSWAVKQDCNDDNPCTADSCSQSTSTATCLSTKATDGTACDDELSATSGTVCTNGVCGLPACVNDGVCCVNSQPANEDGACPDDNNPCTEDACKAGVCTHPNSANTKECRPVAGSCDLPELCDGEGHCPDDQFKPDTERCGLGNGSVCDTDDYCTGFGAECINQKSTDICRAPADDCDYVEMCDGVNDTCPADRTMDDASPCGADQKNQCLAGHCVDCVDDSGCADLADDGNECTTPACNTSTHTCYQKPLAVGHACGDATVTVCDRADTCDGAGVCQVNHEPNTKLCRASDGECDVAESCDGQGKCPEDGFKPNTTPCRSSNGPCDLAESCTGTSATCPLDGKSTASCRAAAGDCDLPATCDGVHDSCPENAKKTDGTSCGQDGSDQCVGGNCVDCLDNSGCQDLAWGLRDEACAKRSCGSNHLCAFSDNSDGTTCGAGGKDQCLGGACKDCVDVSGCAEIALGTRDDECASKACEGNYCVFATQPAGTACSMLGTGTGDQCDDAGVCQDCVDLVGCTDLPDDQNSCTDKACVQNVCQNQNDNTNACSLGTGCTTDACQDGACEPQTVSSGCFIEGVCIGNGAKKGLTGDDSCKVCDHASPNGWKTLVAGEACDDGNSESRNDKCGSDGKCEGIICTPNCTGKECGDDGCGGSCGQCDTGRSCNQNGKCDFACSNGEECWKVAPTGQATCNNNTVIVECPGGINQPICGENPSISLCGQDAQYPDFPRGFTITAVSGDEIVTDSLTHLVWQRTFASGKTYNQAYTYCDNLTYAGLSNWRLPTYQELSSIVEYGIDSKCIDRNVFTATPDNDFWTSTEVIGDVTKVWTREFQQDSCRGWDVFKTITGNVRCVSTSQNYSGVNPNRYSISTLVSDQPVVEDSVTSLQWTGTGNSISLFWEKALDHCESLTYGGMSDWRLPNVNELLSIIDMSKQNFASNIPADMIDSVYWTSTTATGSSKLLYAFVVSMQTGQVVYNYKNGYNYSICVRNKECSPLCSGRQCGSDGCGGSCGTCDDGLSCMLGSCVLSCNEGSQCFPLTPTNQSSCYSGTGIVQCPGNEGSETCGTIEYCGQDAQYLDSKQLFTCHLLSGTAVPCETGGDIVKDSLTGLMWQRGYESGYQHQGFSWSYAINACASLVYAGYDDWRLPSPHELMSIRNLDKTYPCIDTNIFPSDTGRLLWSSVHPIMDPYSDAWAMTPFGTFLGARGYWDYRCVRGGLYSIQGNSPTRFKLFDLFPTEVVVRDQITKLSWQKSYVYHDYWKDALSYCETLDYSGKSDWRLPNINELSSLIDYNTGNPASDFPDMPSERFWSSSPYSYSLQILSVDFGSGSITNTNLDNTKFTRCVRGGPTCNFSCEKKQCGDDGCGGTCGSCGANQTCNASGQCEATTPPEPAHEIILKDTAIVVPEEVAATVDSPVCGTMRFPFENGQPPFTVVPGNTIVSGLGTGFLCRVLTVATQGSELVLTTEAGTLSDVIESGTLQFKVPLAIADAPGKRKSLTASLTLPSRTLYDNHGLTVTLRPGSLTFQPDLNVRADYGLIEGPYFLATVSGTMTADAGIDMELGATASIDGQVTVYEQSFPFYFQAGPLPVAGRVIVSVKPGFSASASGTLSSSYGARSTRTVTAGAEYSDHQWRSVNVTNQSTVERYGPNVDASVGLQAEVKVDVQSELLLYETASANILVAPRVEGDLTPHANWSYDWDLDACVWGGIGADIEIFHHALVSYDKTLFNLCRDLWSGSGCINQCATKNLYCSTPGTVEGCGEMDDGDNCLDTYYKECAANQTCKSGACVGECTSGACCNTTTQSYKAAGAVCKTDYQYICKLGSACGGTVTRQKQTQACTGTSADCKGPVSAWADDSAITCTSDQKCLAGQSSCAPCSTDGCTSGPCCDTASTPKTVRSASYVCEPNSAYEYSCPDGTGAGSDVYIRFRDRYCPGGQETSCTGSLGSLKTEEVFAYCGNSEHCNAATGTCDPNGCTSSNWCQTNNHGSGSYCSASNTVTTCRTSNGCFEVANTTTCSTGQGCSNGSCTDSCSSICSGYCGTYLGCNCGSCSSGEVCGPDHLCYDCAGARKCDVFINSTEAEIFRGNTESNTVGACTTISTPGWHNGPTVNNINLRWTWVTGCTPPPDGGNLTNYAGDNARYNFYVPVEGYYTIKVKIPAVGYLCANQQNTRHADDVYYGLIRPLEQGRVFGPFATSQFKGQWMPLTATPLHLYAGDQTLILYDHGSTGSGCIGTSSRWVFVDSVEVKWDH